MEIQVRQLKKYAEAAADLLDQNGSRYTEQDVVKVASFLIEKEVEDMRKVAAYDAQGRIVARAFYGEVEKIAYAGAAKAAGGFGKGLKEVMHLIGQKVSGKTPETFKAVVGASKKVTAADKALVPTRSLRESVGLTIARHPYISAGAGTGATALTGAAILS
jgi:hypothetical protein